MNFAMPSCLASHLICKLYQAILFFRYILHLSTMLVHSTALRVHQPFDTVMANSGVKTRSSEQTMLSDEAHILLVTDSCSEEDSETNDQSYPPPPEVHALTWQGYVAHIVRMIFCIAMSFA